jgi:hypothetical protein
MIYILSFPACSMFDKTPRILMTMKSIEVNRKHGYYLLPPGQRLRGENFVVQYLLVPSVGEQFHLL